MNILHIINDFDAGGAQTLVKDLASSQNLKNKVTVCSVTKVNNTFSDNLIEKLIQNNVNVVQLMKKKGSKFSFFASFYHLLKLFKYGNFSIVNSHLPMAHIYAALILFLIDNRSVKHILTVHNGPEKWNRLCMFLNKKKPVIFCSYSAFSLSLLPNELTKVINNGIIPPIINSTNDTFKQNLLLKYNLESDCKIVISIGALGTQKNYQFLGQIAKEFKEKNKVHFFICGGPINQISLDLINMFKNIKNIHYLGIRSDVHELIQVSDLFLSCSTHEGLPIAVLEAFFHGIPCVLSPIEQHAAIGEEMPFCIIPNEFIISDFITSLEKYLFDDLQQDKLSIIDKRNPFLKKYDIKIASDEYIKFYNVVQNKL